MKRHLITLVVVAVSVSGCFKDKGCSPVPPSSEETVMLNFINSNSITATKHSTGMYYQVVNAGSGAVPAANSIVTANFTGTFFDGTVFGQSTSPITFQMAELIEAWRVGLPLIAKGGRIKLIVPSAMAYGCNGVLPQNSTPGISANTPLYFDITLVNVQ